MKHQRVFKSFVMILGSVLLAAPLTSCQGDGAEGTETVVDGAVDGFSQWDTVDAGFPQPVIPEPSMRCPFFVTGIQEIMLLTVQMWVGEKNPMAEGALLFYWHGMGSVSSEAEAIPRTVKREILSQGGIIVAPQDSAGGGISALLGAGTWGDRDFEFTDLIASCAVREHNINPRRIYSTGCSAGGLQTGNMVFKRSSYLAAAVANSGGLVLPLSQSSLQDPSHVPPVMTIHGAAEVDIVFISFANSSRTLDQSIIGLGGFAINCNHQGGHCVLSEQDYIASWQFLKDHPYGIETEPYDNGLPATFPEYCEIMR